MRITNYDKELLRKIYFEIHKLQTSFTQSKLYDYIVPLDCGYEINDESKSKYIRGSMPQKVIEYYRNRRNKLQIEKHIMKWLREFSDTGLQVVLETMVGVLDSSDQHKEFAAILEDERNNDATSDAEIFYAIFRYCLTGECEMNHMEKFDIRSKALQEFNEEVLMQYGISGYTGRNVILHKAGMGTDNPYVLFEAAEIEYMNCIYYGKNEGLEKAYEYYKKASNLGFALADWSLGFLAYESQKRSWYIKDYANMPEQQKIKTAIEYFTKAMEKGCSKAFNSMGNIVKENSRYSQLLQGLKSAKEYYYDAAERKNLFGMYNYARMLEDELRKQVNSKENKKKNDQMHEKGKEMMKYFSESAELGYPKANYRCGLYYGHLSDDNTINHDNFCVVDKDEQLAMNYLNTAVDLNDDMLLSDCYLYLLEYILDKKNSLVGWDFGGEERKEYLLQEAERKMAQAEQKHPERVSERQKRHLRRVQQKMQRATDSPKPITKASMIKSL